METSFFGRRLSMLVLMICGLLGSSVSVMGFASMGSLPVASSAVKLNNQNYRMLVSVVRAFEVDELQEDLFKKYLLGYPNTEAAAEYFLKTPEFNDAVAALHKAVERSSSPALRARIADMLRHMNANNGRLPAERISRLTFDQDYSNALMDLGYLIEDKFSRIIPQEHVAEFKKLMESHVYPAPRTWRGWFNAQREWLSSKVSTKALVTSLIIAAVVGVGGYAAWQQFGLGDKINELFGRVKNVVAKAEAELDDVKDKKARAANSFWGRAFGLGGESESEAAQPETQGAWYNPFSWSWGQSAPKPAQAETPAAAAQTPAPQPAAQKVTVTAPEPARPVSGSDASADVPAEKGFVASAQEVLSSYTSAALERVGFGGTSSEAPAPATPAQPQGSYGVDSDVLLPDGTKASDVFAVALPSTPEDQAATARFALLIQERKAAQPVTPGRTFGDVASDLAGRASGLFSYLGAALSGGADTSSAVLQPAEDDSEAPSTPVRGAKASRMPVASPSEMSAFGGGMPH